MEEVPSDIEGAEEGVVESAKFYAIKESDDSMFAEVGNFITQNEKLHDVHFLVGDKKERIGAVRLFLINQSRVWWSMLSPESPLAETADIHLPDIEPDTFKLLLKHCYAGLDDLRDLSEDTVVQLCYCANKYLMASLTRKIETRLKPADVDELFAALHCLTCYNLHGVKEAVTQIVQSLTKAIFAHPEFMKCDVESIVFISQQDELNCNELELWQAILDWAKRKVDRGDGNELREVMSKPLKHIRLHTLNDSELLQVFGADILTGTEIAQICQKDLRCENKLGEKRGFRTHPTQGWLTLSERIVHIKQVGGGGYSLAGDSCSCIVTGDTDILLKSITCRAGYWIENCKNYKNSLFDIESNYSTNVCLTIKRITNFMTNTSSETPVVIMKDGFQYPIFDRFTISTLIDNKAVMLSKNSKYSLHLEFGSKEDIICWSRPKCEAGHKFEHGTFYCSLAYVNGQGTTPCHILQFNYSVADD